MCCQESGEREASVSLFCPRAKSGEKKFRKVRSPRCLALPEIRSRRPERSRSRRKNNNAYKNTARSLASPPTVRSSQHQQRSLPRRPRVSRGHIVFVSRSTADQSASRTRTRNADRERGRPIRNGEKPHSSYYFFIIISFLLLFPILFLIIFHYFIIILLFFSEKRGDPYFSRNCRREVLLFVIFLYIFLFLIQRNKL